MLFSNRKNAGQALAERLADYADDPNLLVLALPRGGVPVAYEVARRLQAPLDVFLVRKLGLPGQEELAMGALASGGVRAFALTRVLTRHGERVASHRATFAWLAGLRVHFFARALRLPALDLAAFRQGDLLGRVLADFDTLDQLPLRVLVPTAQCRRCRPRSCASFQ